MVATKLTQSPSFLKTPPKLFQPPFWHWPIVVGNVGASAWIRPIELLRTFVNQRAPSGPAVIPYGPAMVGSV